MAHGEVKRDPYPISESASPTPSPIFSRQRFHRFPPRSEARGSAISQLIEIDNARGSPPAPAGATARRTSRPDPGLEIPPLCDTGPVRPRRPQRRRTRKRKSLTRLTPHRMTQPDRHPPHNNRSPAGGCARRGAGWSHGPFWPRKFGKTADTVSICDVFKGGAGILDTSNITRWSHFLDDALLLIRGRPRSWRSLQP